MLHQIRKMIAMALAEYKMLVDDSHIAQTLTKANSITPMVPGFPLILTNLDFTDYNKNKSGYSELPLRADDFYSTKNIRIVQVTDTSTLKYKIINPADGDIVWNDTLNCWQVTFNATGLGMFFITSTLSGAKNLPLLADKALMKKNIVVLQANEYLVFL